MNIKRVLKRFTCLLIALAIVFTYSFIEPMVAYGATLSTNISGLTASYDNGEWTASDTTLSGSATGTAKTTCDSATSVTSVLTLKNTSGSLAQISFDYAKPSIAGGGYVKIDGTSVTAAGSFAKELSNNSYITVEILSGNPGAVTSSIVLTNVAVTEKKNVTTTFKLPEGNGSYTVDGTTVTAEFSDTRLSTEGYVLVATPASGYKLEGWYSPTKGTFLATSAIYNAYFEDDLTIYPIFIPSTTPVWEVGTKWFADLNEAISYANSNSISKIVLVSNGTLAAGTYTVPSGKTLLIPYDTAKTTCADQPEIFASAAPTAPSAYRILTMANGASLVISGNLDVNAKVNSYNNAYTGANSGAFGWIKMESGSTVTMQSGSKLHGYGFITGDGIITAKSGSTVYEPFQICDIRGGTATSNMNGNSQKVLPFSQYYVQNIETELKIEYGATENAVGAITISGSTARPTVKFIGSSSAMFQITSGGSFTKKYDPITDRVKYTVSGNATLNTVSMNAYVTINTANYVLPIMENTSIELVSGTTTVNQDLCMIPGSEFKVDNGATVKIASGKNVYIYDRDEWVGKAFIYPTLDMKASYFSPTRASANVFTPAKMVDTKVDVNGTVDATGYFYTTLNGADIVSSEGSGRVTFTTAPKASTTTYQATQNNTSISYTSITANAAWLHNGSQYADTDEEYTKTAGTAAGKYYSYCEVHDKWELGDPHEIEFELTSWNWASDYSSATALFTCTTDPSITKEISATVNSTTTAATCDTAGSTVYTATATYDGQTYTDEKTVVIDALGHRWDSGVVTTQPTCTEPGVKTYTCLNDSTHTYTEPIPATGHTEVTIPEVEPTCTETGLTAGTQCSVCGEILTAQEVVPAKGHTLEEIPAVDATCTQAGSGAGVKCSVCGVILTEPSTVPALGHNWGEWVVTLAATCTDAGTEKRTCSRCNEEETQAITALGHEPVTDAAVSPTCTETGLTEGSHCSRCGAVIVAQETVAALGHTPAVDPAAAPTCTDTGLTEGSHCSVCGVVLTAQEVIAALGHNYEFSGWNWAEDHSTASVTFTCQNDNSHVQTVEAVVTTERTEPTCENAGRVVYTAKATFEGTEYTNSVKEDLNALGHDLVHYEAQAATCTEIGWNAYDTCSRCDYTTYVEIPALGHDPVTDAAVAPTCTETGLTEGSHCSRCDAVLVAQETVDALGHTPVTDAAVAPTCTETGLTEGSHCSRCNQVLVAQETIDALGHTPVTDAAVAPTCTETGLTEGSHCSRCDAIIVAQETVDALGHDPVIDAAVAPTCTETGLTEGSHCSRCDAVLVAQETIDALGHDPVTDAAVAPTCTETGLTEGSHCSRCDAVLVAQETVDALGHDLIHHDAQTATCTAVGWEAYDTCSRCDYTTYVEIPATGHTPGEAVHENEVAATCTAAGNYDEVVYCSVCDAELSRETKTVEALGHDLVPHEAQAATCTAIGWEAYDTCSRCDYTTYVEIPALGHNWKFVDFTWVGSDEEGYTSATANYVCQNDANHVDHKSATVTVETKDATCTVAGTVTYTATIDQETALDGEERTDSKVVTGQPLGHNYELTAWNWAEDYSTATAVFTCKNDSSHVENVPAEVTITGSTEPTCLTEGSIIHYATVTFEGHKYTNSRTEVIAALGHDLVHHGAQAATCTAIGWDAYDTCSRCDYTTYVEIPALGHDLVHHDAQAATCTAIGWDAYDTCSRCDYTTYVEIPALGHDLVHHDAQAATCTAIGWDAYDTCSRCDYTTYAEIAALGHDLVHHDAQASTCTAIGWEAYDTCSRCDYTTYVEIPALGHDLVHHDAQAATCTAIGWDAYDTCSRCDYTTYVEISALGHDLVHHEAQAATCTAIGWDAYDTCSRCDYTTYEEIAALGHDLVHHDAQAATCTDHGWNAYDTCSRCDYTTYAEIAALGHDLVHHDAQAATCTAIGWEAYDTCSRCDYSTYVEIPALGHDLVHHDAQAATCTAIGWEAYDTCSRCDYTTYVEIPALGHDLVHHDAQAATCTAIGWDAYDTCSRCDYTTYEEIAALGHDLVHHDAQAATCTAVGWDAYDTCSRCDYTTYVEIPAKGHTPGEAVHENEVAPTCAVAGSYDEVVYCSVCDAELSRETKTVAALGHDLVHHEAKAATCTAIGWEAYDTCSRCDYTTYVEIPALGHDLIHHDAQAATCTAVGWEAYDTCSRCDYTTYEEIAALGHDLVHHDAQAATCTAVGWEAYDTCTRCDYTTYVEIPAKGHTPGEAVHENEVAPTCTATGSYDEVVYCTVCDAELSRETKTVEALGHDLVHHDAQAATCTAIGWEAYDTCSRCDYTTYVEIPALGHDLVHHDAQAATCTAIGWEAYDTCSRCDYTTYVEIPAKGHTPGEAVHENEVAPTCTVAGSYDEVVYCSVCDAELSRETKTVAALGHDFVHHDAQAATCTTIGWGAYDTCSRCDYTTYVEIPATGHTPGEAVHENEVAPTCTVAGSYDEVVYCSVCDAELSRDSKTVAALGHDLVHHDAQAATCTEVGWDAYDTCTRCDYTTYVEIPAKGHTPGEAVHENEVAPTCTATGSYDEVVYCTVCDAELSRETKTVDALGHNLVHHDAQAATCTEVGWDAYDTCTRCDYSTYEEIPALGHDLVHHDAQAATCTDHGWNAYDTCSRCDYTTYVEIPAMGHIPGEAVHENEVSPTCTAAGSYDEVVYCTVCDAELSRETKTTAALGHDLVNHEAQDPTCTEIGWEAYDTCTRCDYTTYVEIPALGHDLVHHEAKEATCTEIGWNTYDTCTRCDYTTYDEIPATGHTPGEAVHEHEVPATCTEAGGYDEVVYCTVCGEELSREAKTVNALGHDLVHHDAQAATCTAIGWDAYDTCTRCDYTTYSEIPAKGHTLVKTDATPATCTEPGNSAYWTCTVCGEHFSDDTAATAITEGSWIIPAPGHNWNNGEVTTEATCTHEGEMLYTCTVCGATRTEVIAKLPHNLMEVPAKDPTCTVDGNEAYYVCQSCNHYFSDATGATEITEGSWIIPAPGHQFGDWVVVESPTCEDQGSEQRTCTVCGFTETQNIDPNGHTWEEEFTIDQEADCTTDGSKSRHCHYCDQKTDVTVIPALGHDWDTENVVFNWSDDLSSAEAVFTCKRDPSHVEHVTAAVTSETAAGLITYTATVVFESATYTDQQVVNAHEVLRIKGKSRYDTCIKIADYYIERNGVDKLPAVVLATGGDFPDALTGAYLANVKNAPIMLIDQSSSARIATYIKNHLAADGTVYILGGKGAVKDEWLTELSGYTLKRMDGKNRFETNLSILTESGAKGGDIFVCTGSNYADSLSASAIDMPILIVGTTLRADQKEYLAGGTWNFHLVGGTSVVSEDIAGELAAYGTVVDRTYGKSRYETSKAMAERFLGETHEAILAYGANFPDGLCGGPLAYTMGAPILLSGSTEVTNSAGIEYATAKNITSGLVLGGASLIDDTTVRTTFAMGENDEIMLYEE